MVLDPSYRHTACCAHLHRVKPLVRLSALSEAVVRLGTLQNVALEELCVLLQLLVLESSTNL